MIRGILKAFGAVLIGAFALSIILAAINPAPSPAPQMTPREIASENAVGACERWTRNFAKVGVGEIMGDREVAPRHGKDNIRVRLGWRSTGPGLLMYSECEYAQGSGTNWALVDAFSGPQ